MRIKALIFVQQKAKKCQHLWRRWIKYFKNTMIVMIKWFTQGLQGKIHFDQSFLYDQILLKQVANLFYLLINQYHILDQEQQMSYEQSTNLARKQLRNAFRTFDTDNTGTIQKHQLGQLLKRLTDAFNVEEPSEEDVNEILKELDVNGDGKISQIQFQALVIDVLKIIEEEKITK